MPLNNISICGRKKRTKGGGGSQTLTWHKSLTNVITKGGESQTLTWHKSLANVIAKGGGVKHWPDTSYLQTSSQREGGLTLTWHKSLTNVITKGGGSNTDLTQVTYKRHHKGRGVKHWPDTSHLQTSSQREEESNADLTQVTYKHHHKGRGSQTLTWHKSLTNVITKGGGVKRWPDTSHLQTSSQREGGSNTDMTQVTYKRHHKGRGVKRWPDTSHLQTSSQRERGSNADLTQVTYITESYIKFTTNR